MFRFPVETREQQSPEQINQHKLYYMQFKFIHIKKQKNV